MLNSTWCGGLRRRTRNVVWLHVLSAAATHARSGPTRSSAAKSTAYDRLIVDPPPVRGRRTLKVALMDETNSSPKNHAMVAIDTAGVVPNARRTAAAATVPAVSQRRRVGSLAQAALSLPIATLGVPSLQAVLGDL